MLYLSGMLREMLGLTLLQFARRDLVKHAMYLAHDIMGCFETLYRARQNALCFFRVILWQLRSSIGSLLTIGRRSAFICGTNAFCCCGCWSFFSTAMAVRCGAVCLGCLLLCTCHTRLLLGCLGSLLLCHTH